MAARESLGGRPAYEVNLTMPLDWNVCDMCDFITIKNIALHNWEALPIISKLLKLGKLLSSVTKE